MKQVRWYFRAVFSFSFWFNRELQGFPFKVRLSIREDQPFTWKSPGLEFKTLGDTDSPKPSCPKNQILLYMEMPWSPASKPHECVLGRRSSEVTASSFSPVVAAAGLVLGRQKTLKAQETICFSHYLPNLPRQFVRGAEPTCLSSPNMSPPSLHHTRGGLRMNTKHTFVPTACHCAPPGAGS